jgi:hypothetical protein
VRLNREAVEVAGCTVELRIRDTGLQGAVRVQTFKTTVPDDAAICPLDLVDRDFSARRPNELWI